MTDTPLDAAAVRRLFLNDEAFRKRYNQPAAFDYDERRLSAIVEYFTQAIPILEDLERRGFVAPQIGALPARYERFDEIIPALIEWARQVPHGQVWADIVEAISQPWAKDHVGPFLIEIYPQTDAKWRAAIARCLPAVASPAIEDDLVRLVEGPARADNVWCRERMLDALASLKTTRAETAILGFRQDSEDPVRLIVAKSLAKFPSPSAVDALRELVRDPKRDVAKAAQASLAKIEKKVAKESAKVGTKH